MDKLRFYAENPDEFEKAETEFLEWCLEQDDFPEEYKFVARNETYRRKYGRVIIGVPKENPDGSAMTREDGQAICDFAYTKGNWDKGIPEFLTFYPAADSTRAGLNLASSMLERGEIPKPSLLPLMIPDLFDNGLPATYMLLNPEQRALAQKSYVCQLDDDVPVILLVIPDTNGVFHLEWIHDGMRPFDMGPKSVSAEDWFGALADIAKEWKKEKESQQQESQQPEPTSQQESSGESWVDSGVTVDDPDYEAIDKLCAKVNDKLISVSTGDEGNKNVLAFVMEYAIRMTEDQIKEIKKGLFLDHSGQSALDDARLIFENNMKILTVDIMGGDYLFEREDLQRIGEYAKIDKALNSISGSADEWLLNANFVLTACCNFAIKCCDSRIQDCNDKKGLFNRKEMQEEIDLIQHLSACLSTVAAQNRKGLEAWFNDTSDYL